MYLAVDIGGTKTLVALFSKRGRVIKRYKFKTSWQKERFVRELTAVLKHFSRPDLLAVVVAVPGVVQKNCSVRLGNRDWGDFSLVETVQAVFDCPIYFENDANLAAVYESYRLPGKTVFLTFSTGIGGGIATRGHILPESDEFEPGHKIYVWDGQPCEWEDIASANAIRRAYHDQPVTTLKGRATYFDIANRVAIGLKDIILAHQPNTIILGGPLALTFKKWRMPLKIILRDSLPPHVQLPKINCAKRPNLCVSYGACYYGEQKSRQHTQDSSPNLMSENNSDTGVSRG